MKLLYLTVDDSATRQSQYYIEEWRRQRHIVATMPIERLLSYLHFDPSSGLALVDAIVCGPNLERVSFRGALIERMLSLASSMAAAKRIRMLPEQCAMRDGRKWKTVPVITFENGIHSIARDYEVPDEFHVLPLICSSDPLLALRRIRHHVDECHDRILADYVNLGMLVRFEGGHVQIGPALRKKKSKMESAYYYPKADRRSNRGWVTVKRDNQALRLDVHLFQRLIDTNANEAAMHRFFEQHPAFLMDALLGVPISHRPVFTSPARFTPDYSLLPILGPASDGIVDFLELKGPGETTLVGGLHRGFASKIHRAVDQVRDYDRCLRDPANAAAVLAAFGYIPSDSRLAVLIGRTPTGIDHDVFLRRQSEISVKIVTYDEIFEMQAGQVRHPA